MAGGIRVLCVDDESALLKMGKLFLEQSGEFSVDTVLSATEALEILNNTTYDAIVSDYLMPEMDGIEFLKKVRANDETLPFIIFTGRSREEVVIEALNNGADFYLHKGGNPGTLYKELIHFIRQSVLMRQARMALAEQEQRYHDLQNANDLIQSVAPDGRFLFVNKKWLETLGYQEHEVPDLSIFDIIDEESLQHCMETFQRVISGENVGIIDTVFRTRDGKKVYVEGIANCRMADGQPQYTRGIFKDVTDRKRADAALKESEARYRNVVEDQTEFISRFRPDGTHVFVNDAYCRYFNKTREEIMGKLFMPRLPEDDRAGVAQHLSSLTREHPVASASNRVIMDDGQIRWQQWSNRAIFDNEGNLLEYQSVGRDITELKAAEDELSRKNDEINAAFEELTATEEELRHNYNQLSQQEQALRESEETFRAMVEQSGDGIVILDFSGIIQFANRMAWDLVEFPPDMRTPGTVNVLEVVSPEQREDAIHDFLRVSHGIDSYVVNYKILTFEKREIWIECIGRKISFKGSPAILLSFRDATNRWKEEHDLKESEDTFRTIFENSPYPIAINSLPDHKFMEVNPAFLKSSGFTAAEVLGKSPHELGLLSLLDYGKLVSRFLITGKIENVPLALKGKGGIPVHVLFSTIPVTINDRSALLTVTSEMTGLKMAEEELLQKNEELQASEDNFRKIFESSAQGMTLASPDLRFILVNPACLSMLGYSDEEFRKLSYIDITSPDNPSLDLENIRALEAGSIPVYSSEKRFIRKDGSSLWGSLSITTVRNQDGTLRHYLVQIEDITPRKLAEELVRESENKFATVFQSSPVALTLVSARDGTFVDVNNVFLRSTGYSRDEVIGISPEDLGIFADYKEREMLESSLRDRQTVHDIEISCRIKTGEIRNCLFSSSIVQIGGTPHIFSTIRDITERKRAEVALRQANKKLNILTSITRHDINNQLLVLNGFLEFLHKKVPDPVLGDYFTRITKASSRISAMIRFTKVYEEIGVYAPVWQDCCTLVNTVVKEIHPEHVIVKNDIPPGSDVFADPMIVRVCYNLIDNAVRHGGKITTLRFYAGVLDGDYIIVSEDDGVGIPFEEKEMIFERGFGKNTGLGLFLSREILSITGITIRETGRPGEGAHFEMRVPKGAYRFVQT